MRKKIEPDPSSRRAIVTELKVGYRFIAERLGTIFTISLDIISDSRRPSFELLSE